MIITNENYKDILPALSQLNSNDKIIFTVDNIEFHYHPVSSQFLVHSGPGDNDAIFKILKIEPYDFCTKSYGTRPYSGIFPVVPDGDPRKLLQVTYDLFEECKKTLFTSCKEN